MPKEKINGINLYYEVEGHGHPLLLIAGLTCDLTFWAPIRKELARYFQLILLDNRGAGLSDTPIHPYTIEEMASDAMSLTAHLGIKKAHVLGHSMGGAIAQMLTYKYPSIVNKLVLCNTFIKFIKTAEMGLKLLLGLHRDNFDPARLAEAALPWLFSNAFLSNPQNIAAFIDGALNHPHSQSYMGHLRQFNALTTFDSTPWFHTIQKPTLVIASDEDPLCPMEGSLELSGGMTDAELYTFHHMSHLSLIEKPEEFNTILIDFLNR